MSTQQLLVGLLPYLLSVLLIAIAASFLWPRRDKTAAAIYLLLMAGELLWGIGYIFELAAMSLEGKVFWDMVQWPGVMLVINMMLLFALRYTGRRVTRGMEIALFGSVAVITVLALTYQQHDLLIVDPHIIPNQPFNLLTYEFTPLVWGITVYTIGVVTAMGYLLLRHAGRTTGIQREQTLILAAGLILPAVTWFGGSAAGITLTSSRDIGPLAFAISNGIITWGLLRFSLFRVVPIAHNRIIETMQDAVIVLDPKGVIVESNPPGLAWLNLTQSSFFGTALDDLDTAQARTLWAHLNKGSTKPEITVGERIYQLDVSHITGRRGRSLGHLVLIRDITDARQIARQLQQRAEALQEINRNLDSARESAEQARLRAEEADRMKSQFLASMSHELRTPLNAILSFNKLMQMGTFGPLTSEQSEYLGKMQGASEHLLSLINDVLDITKIQSGMLELFIEDDFDANHELQDIAQVARNTLGDKPVQVEVTVDEHMPMIPCDKRRIRQVLLNLVSNAVKFTHEGHIRLTLCHENDEVRFEVSDTGPGIEPEKMTIIFEPFIQSQTGIKHAGGTGLGLAISRQLVEIHGGKLWVESVLEHGASFYFTIPLNQRATANKG